MDYVRPDRQLFGEPRLVSGARVRGTPHLAGLQIPEPQFPSKITVGRRPAPAAIPRGQPEPSQRPPRVDQLRWARCPDDRRLHLLRSADVGLATAKGHAQALCGHRIPAHGLTINSVPSGALCMTCVSGATS